MGPEGEVTSWTASAGRILGLVKLDGADTALLHVLLASEVHSGMRVRAVLAKERKGEITDIVGFEPL